jgi:hypothetical protein
MMRAVASVPPPAPHGTMSCTGLLGYCASAAEDASTKANARNFLTKLLLRVV